MKKVTFNIKGLPSTHQTRWLIEDENDLAQYAEVLAKDVNRGISTIFTSNVPTNKWDHIKLKGQSAGLWSKALLDQHFGKLDERNAMFELIPSGNKKIEKFAEHLLNGKKILVNEVGGYCLLDDTIDNLKVIEENSSPTQEPKYQIKPNTKIIVLENDPTLPKESKEMVERLDVNYSVIYELRYHSNLKGILSQFKQAGGQEAFVYTTGMDVKQMYEYTNALVDAEIKEISFYFVNGENDQIKEFLDWASRKIKVNLFL